MCRPRFLVSPIHWHLVRLKYYCCLDWPCRPLALAVWPLPFANRNSASIVSDWNWRANDWPITVSLVLRALYDDSFVMYALMVCDCDLCVLLCYCCSLNANAAPDWCHYGFDSDELVGLLCWLVWPSYPLTLHSNSVDAVVAHISFSPSATQIHCEPWHSHKTQYRCRLECSLWLPVLNGIA